MILTTTPSVEGRAVTAHLGICTGEVIVGANIFRDLRASWAPMRWWASTSTMRCWARAARC